MMDYIIWDWNGTLMDDSEISLRAMNTVLEKYGLARLSSQRYMEIFTFPVIEYYKSAGFELDKIPFEELSSIYISEYNGLVSSCRLTANALEVLSELKKLGITQILLSASESGALLSQAKALGADGYFEYIAGSDNIHAYGKAELARAFIKDHALDKRRGMLIGDTVHDYETSLAAGCKCVLYFSGHQSISRLKECGVPIISSLTEITELLADS